MIEALKLKYKPELHTAQPLFAQFGFGGIVGFLAVIIIGEFRDQVEAFGHLVVEAGPDHGPDHVVIPRLPDIRITGLVIAEIDMGDRRTEN